MVVTSELNNSGLYLIILIDPFFYSMCIITFSTIFVFDVRLIYGPLYLVDYYLSYKVIRNFKKLINLVFFPILKLQINLKIIKNNIYITFNLLLGN